MHSICTLLQLSAFFKQILNQICFPNVLPSFFMWQGAIRHARQHQDHRPIWPLPTPGLTGHFWTGGASLRNWWLHITEQYLFTYYVIFYICMCINIYTYTYIYIYACIQTPFQGWIQDMQNLQKKTRRSLASPRYHQSNDTVPPSFNLKIFSWVETWIHQRCFRNVFGGSDGCHLKMRSFLQTELLLESLIWHLQTSSIQASGSRTSSIVIIPPFTQHSSSWIDYSRHVPPKLVLRILPHLGNGDACGMQICWHVAERGHQKSFFSGKNGSHSSQLPKIHWEDWKVWTYPFSDPLHRRAAHPY